MEHRVICLMPSCAYLSEVTRMVEIYRELRKRGVQTRVATHGGTYEDVLRSAGVPSDLVGSRMSAQRCATFVRSAVGVGSVRQSMYTDEEIRTYARAEADYFRANRVRVVVTGFTLTTLLSTRIAGVPLVTEHAGCWVPPVFERALLPAAARLPWPVVRHAPSWLTHRLMSRIAQRARFYTSGFNRVAAELGVEPVPSLAALLMGDLTLVPEIPEVLGIPADDLAAWRPRQRSPYRPSTRIRYVGPLYARLDSPLPADVAEFLNAPSTVIYVAITSSSPALVRAVVGALTAVDARVLVAAPTHDLRAMSSDRVKVAGLMPSHVVMPRVDLAITAGGQGSVQTAMATGTPLIGVPLQPEQDLNVALVERLGAARRIDPRDAGTPTLAGLAREMLADDAYRRAAGRIQRLYAAVDGPRNAADAIIGLAHCREPASPTAVSRRME